MISFVLVHISCCSLSFLVIIVRLCMFSFFSILYYHMSKHIQISLSLNICLQHQMAMKKSSCRDSTLGVPIQTCVERNEITMTINVINKSKIHFSALNRVQTYFIFIFYYKESSMTECIAWGSNNFNFVKHQNVFFLFFDFYFSASFHYAQSCQ